MKNFKYIVLVAFVTLNGCSDTIDLSPKSNIVQTSFYSNLSEVNTALIGCYKGLQAPIADEWSLTELRSDNTWVTSTGSSSSINIDFSSLDMFSPSTSNQGIYNYWLNCYNNIYNVNTVMNSLGAFYNITTNTIDYREISIPITSTQAKKVAAEASFIRAYHYFNLVRLYGGVFLVHNVITPEEAKTMNRVSEDEIYKLIIADLINAAANGDGTTFSQIAPSNLGRANAWIAKALLAKVYLTLNRKSDAIPLLQDVISNSGYSILPSYADVFSPNNEMNSEIMFAVRFKGGGQNQGNQLPNQFAPLNSGAAVINGDGKGLNGPTNEIIAAFITADSRKTVNIGTYATKTYVKKYMSNIAIAYDSDADWPVLRFSDVVLMMAEALGKDGTSATSLGLNSIDYLNKIHARAGLPVFSQSDIATDGTFETKLAFERRLEFAFENQRWFDLLRYNKTFTTITAEQTLHNHFTASFTKQYSKYPGITIPILIAASSTEHLILPIPQREIDNNTQLVIPQNSGY